MPRNLSIFHLPFSPPHAQYYNSDLSIWLSVDPLADKYPNLSPYTYCADNPVRIFDEDGADLYAVDDKWQYNSTTHELKWLSDEGGETHQTVLVTEGDNGSEQITQSVDFDGYIGNMFNFSVVSPKTDGIINGVLDIGNGIEMFMAGVAIAAGAGAMTGGGAAPIGTAFCFAGGGMLANGVQTIANSIENSGNFAIQQNMVKEVCKTGVGVAASLMSNISKFRKLVRIASNISVSMAWLVSQEYRFKHPKNMTYPANAIIRKY